MFKNKNENNASKIKAPFLLSDFTVAIMAVIPGINFLTPIFLLARYFKYRTVKKVVLENFNNTVNFTMIPQASEYRESLKIAQKAN